jgi:hypothetical protein
MMESYGICFGQSCTWAQAVGPLQPSAPNGSKRDAPALRRVQLLSGMQAMEMDMGDNLPGNIGKIEAY